VIEPAVLADELRSAYARRELVAPPSSRDPEFNLDAAYAVEAAARRARRAEGWRVVGHKVGYASKAVWRALKLDTIVWAAMYDRTVHHAQSGRASLSMSSMVAPKIEPEIVIKTGKPVESADPAAVLASAEWIALGFEIIDCVYPDWKFKPADFVAAFGLHAALVVGEPRRVAPDTVNDLAGQLSQFRVVLSKNGELIEEGAGKNALGSPAACLAELAAALQRRAGAEPLEPGYLVSTGTLTTSTPCAPGEQWNAAVKGLDVESLTLDLH
jgi:2-keto-4-pentenoate hydratase